MTIAVFVVAEAARDARVVQSLIKRVGDAKIGPEVQVDLVGPSTGYDPCFVAWKYLPKVMKDHGVKARHGHFGKQPKAADGGAAANALLVARSWLKQGSNSADLVVLQRDIDKQPERADGLAQARAEVLLPSPTKLAIGVAKPKVEAWAICAIEVGANEALQRSLENLRRDLGFDPRLESHQLEASDITARRSAKRVLEALLGSGDEAYEPLCETTPVEVLEARGKTNGLTALLAELAAAI